MRIRFLVPDLDCPESEPLNEQIVREVDVVPRRDEHVALCPEGEDRARDFIVQRVTHHADLNTIEIHLASLPYPANLARIISEGDEDSAIENPREEP